MGNGTSPFPVLHVKVMGLSTAVREMNMIDVNELQNCLPIDKLNLDEELIKQPVLFYQISDEYARLCQLRDTKKEILADVDAELDSQLRMNNSEKLTENKIKNMVQMHPAHKEAFIAFNEAKYQADRVAAIKEAFHTRAYMLRDLVQLFITGYFQDDSVKDTTSTSELKYSANRVRLAETRKAHS
jgi:hypothetical protein